MSYRLSTIASGHTPVASSAPPLHQGAVLFEPGRAELTADRHVLEEVVQLLRSLPGDSVIILEGHAGPEGREQEDRLRAQLERKG